MNHLRSPCFAHANLLELLQGVQPIAVIKVLIAVDHQTHRPSHPLGYCQGLCNINRSNNINHRDRGVNKTIN
jgi:hypothetical protein